MSSQDDRVRELESKLEEALAAVRDLRYENDLLRARVVDRRPESTDTPARDPMPLGAVGTTIGRDSSEAEKITLFRSLFSGRDDVYAYRWESRDGRSGYAPALRPGAQREKGSGQIRPFSYRSTIAWLKACRASKVHLGHAARA